MLITNKRLLLVFVGILLIICGFYLWERFFPGSFEKAPSKDCSSSSCIYSFDLQNKKIIAQNAIQNSYSELIEEGNQIYGIHGKDGNSIVTYQYPDKFSFQSVDITKLPTKSTTYANMTTAEFMVAVNKKFTLETSYGTLKQRNGNTVVLEKNGKEVWSFKLGDDALFLVSEPILYENTIFFGSYSAGFYSIDVRNGQLKWKLNVEIGTEMSLRSYRRKPFIYNKSQVVGVKDNGFTFFDINTGSIIYDTQYKLIDSAISGDVIKFNEDTVIFTTTPAPRVVNL